MAGLVATISGMSQEEIAMAMLAATTAVEHNFAHTALRHAGLDVDVKDELVDEDSLKEDAKAKGVSQKEQEQVRTKLNQLSQESLENSSPLTATFTEAPTSYEGLEAIKKTVVKNYVQKIATVSENIHQILKEHPWAEKTLTSSLHLFGNCVRAMFYLDMAALGSAGGAALCGVGGIKDPRVLTGCAAVGGIGLMGTAAFLAEPVLEAAIREGVTHLSSGAAEHFGDTAAEKAAIRQLVGDTANLAGILAGGKYLHHRMSNIGNFKGAINEADVVGVQATNTVGNKLNIKIETPYELAEQSMLPSALTARKQVESGATLYRIGKTNKSHAAEGQFWSLENPLTAVDYVKKHGMPATNAMEINFIEIGTLKANTPFITRPAPGLDNNLGGAIEVVVHPNGVQLKSFSIIDK